ncbi:UNVERIFIED_CONTAM: hypothetical protein GTU68_029229 [Idotea baltica]|nr:hypothetical protein [Idotea baltica]
MAELNGQVALVTGASRGIGKAIALKLAASGAKVYVNYSSGKDAADQVVSLCKELDGDAVSLGFNVANSSEVNNAIKQIKSESGRLDILVNNAGITILDVNLKGSFYCARAAAKIMMKQKYGRIINISSVVGEMGNSGQAGYVSSKAGVIGLTKTLARELASRNITSNAITPGFIETDMTEALDEKVKAEHFKAIPLGKYGSADDIASLVNFISSAESSYITGQVIGVNGGMYM